MYSSKLFPSASAFALNAARSSVLLDPTAAVFAFAEHDMPVLVYRSSAS